MRGNPENSSRPTRRHRGQLVFSTFFFPLQISVLKDSNQDKREKRLEYRGWTGIRVAGLAQRQDDAVRVESRGALHVLGASVADYLGRRSGRPLLGAGARIVVRFRSRRSKGVDVDAEQDGDDEEGHYIGDTSSVIEAQRKHAVTYTGDARRLRRQN